MPLLKGIRYSLLLVGCAASQGLAAAGVGPQASEAEALSTELTLAALEAQVLEKDERVQQAQAQLEGARAHARAASSLPDPEVRLGLQNLPIDSFALDQEPMTQAQVTVSQRFPAGDSRAIAERQAQAQVRGQVAGLVAQQQQRLREARLQWLRVWRAERDLHLVREQTALLETLRDTEESRYVAGRSSQGSLALLEARIAQLAALRMQRAGESNTARATLARWSPAALNAQWPVALPARLRTLPTTISLDNPEIARADAQWSAAQAAVALAKQAYRPQWSVSAGYGYREDRVDFFSAGVSLTLPLFPDQRQDPRLSSSQANAQAARWHQRDLVASLNARKAALLAQIEALDQRIEHYQHAVIPALERVVQLTSSDYEAGRSSSAEVLNARESILIKQRDVLDLIAQRGEQLIALNEVLGETKE